MPLWGREKKKEELTRILYATDIHGSERTFLKFINAAKLYKANVLILGGDITGKMVTPIIKQRDGTYITNFMDVSYCLKTEKEVEELQKKISFVGFYPFCMSEEEAKELQANREKANKVFMHLMQERIEKWIKLAEERLRDTDIKCYITTGNDDPPEISQLIKNYHSKQIINPEGEVVYIDDHHEMISCGYGNITPWNCPRDISEGELAEKIEDMASKVNNMLNCIFNFHVPPRNSGLDVCPRLDTSISPPKPIVGEFINAGSIAVYDAIKKYSPLLGLFGHIHESRGAIKIGRTLCLNPGSEYSEGILRGVIIDLTKDQIKSYQFFSG